MTDQGLVLQNNPGHNVLELIQSLKNDLVALAQIYMISQVAGQAEATIDAKKRDLQIFFDYYRSIHNSLDPSFWFKSTTESFIKTLVKDSDYSQASIARIYSSVRHFARWLHDYVKPFKLGCPTNGVKPPEEPKGDWQGLSKIQKLRLLTAAQTLIARPGRGTNQGLRDYAAVATLLGSGLRVSELLGLDVRQYNSKGFTDVLRKGGNKVKFVPLKRESRSVLEDWLKEQDDNSGALFTTRTGKRLGRKQLYEVLQRMVNLANANVPEDEKINISPHTLRHTFLRKLADEKGIHYAMEAADHKSGRYIWRYVKPDQESLADAIDDLD